MYINISGCEEKFENTSMYYKSLGNKGQVKLSRLCCFNKIPCLF